MKNVKQALFKEDLKITGVFLTKYDQRKNLNKQVKDVLEQTFKGKVFNTNINTNVALAEAPSHKKTFLAMNLPQAETTKL